MAPGGKALTLEELEPRARTAFTVLYFATCWGDVARVTKYLGDFAPYREQVFSACDQHGVTLLIHAIDESQPAILRAFIKAGAPLEVVARKYGSTPLYYAAQKRGCAQAVRDLLAAGANPEFAHAATGNTALMAAVIAKSDEAALALLEAGAAYGDDTVNLGNYTTADVAAVYDNARVFMALVERGIFGGDAQQIMLRVVEYGAVNVLEACLAQPGLRRAALATLPALLEVGSRHDRVREILLAANSQAAIEAALPAEHSSGKRARTPRGAGPAL